MRQSARRQASRAGSRSSSRSVLQAIHQPHRAMRFGKARDLVVDKAGVEARLDDVRVAQLAAATFWTDDPYGTVRLDPRLHLVDAEQVGPSVCRQEYEVAQTLRPPARDVGGALTQV